MTCTHVISSKIGGQNDTSGGTSLPIEPMPCMDPAKRWFSTSAPAKDTVAGPTKGGPKGRTKGGYHYRHIRNTRPSSNVKRTSHNECAKSNNEASTEIYKTSPPTPHTKQCTGHSSTNHTSNSSAPGPNQWRSNAGVTFSLSEQDAPAHPSHEAPEKDPKGPFYSHRRPITKPQHNQSAGHKFSYRQGMEQLAPALHPKESTTERRRNRGHFRTLGNANGTSYDGGNDICAPLGARAYPWILSKYFPCVCACVRACVRPSVPLQISVGCVYFV